MLPRFRGRSMLNMTIRDKEDELVVAICRALRESRLGTMRWLNINTFASS